MKPKICDLKRRLVSLNYSSSIFNFLPWKRIIIKFLLALAKIGQVPCFPPPYQKKKKKTTTTNPQNTQNLCGQNFYSMGYILSSSFPSLQPSPFPDSSCSISRWIYSLSRIHIKLYCFKPLKSWCCLLLQPNVAYSDVLSFLQPFALSNKTTMT